MRDTLALQYGILASAVLAGVVAGLAFLAALGVFSSASGQDDSSGTVTIVAGTPYTEDSTNTLISKLGIDARCASKGLSNTWKGWRKVRLYSLSSKLDLWWNGVRIYPSNEETVAGQKVSDYHIVGTLLDTDVSAIQLAVRSLCTTPTGTEPVHSDELFDIEFEGTILFAPEFRKAARDSG